jgi:hypothetical protein
MTSSIPVSAYLGAPRRTPGYLLASTLILALGIGSTAAVFGLLNTLRDGMWLTMIGVSAGLALSWIASRAVQGVVLNSGGFDAVAFAGAAALLGLTVLTASWLPARRAVRVATTTFSRS